MNLIEPNELSERELEILRLVATGASNKEIAHQLYISANTVKVHLRNIFGKIGAASRTEAAMYAVQIGLVPSVPAQVPGEIESALNGQLARQTADAVSASSRRITTRAIWLIGIVVLLASITVGALALRGPGAPVSDSLAVPTGLPRWQVKNSLPTGRMGLATAVSENMIYAIGGEAKDGVTAALEGYDLVNRTWQTLTPKPQAVSDVRAAVIGGKIYVPGGRLPSGEPTDLLEIYDPRVDAWAQGARLPGARSAYALATFEGKIYVFGGWDGQRYQDTVYVYDPGQEEWEERTSMPTPRAFAAAANSGDRIYVIGGRDASGLLSVNEIYLPFDDDGAVIPWVQGTALPEGRSGLGVVAFADFLYVVGGNGPEQKALASLQYFPQQESWQAFDAPFPEPWSNFGLAAAGSQLYVLGGQSGRRVLDNFLVYQAIYTVSIPFLSGEQ